MLSLSQHARTLSARAAASLCRSHAIRFQSTNQIGLDQSQSASSQIKLPSITPLEQDPSHLNTLFSNTTIQDIYFKQNDAKLGDLIYGLEESSMKSYLESSFESGASSASPSSSDFLSEYKLVTNNAIVDQYYRLLSRTAKKPEESLVYQSASSIYNLYYFISSLKQNSDCSFAKADEKDLFNNRKSKIFEQISNPPTNAKELVKWINSSFGSLIEFKNLLLNSAAASKGNSYTWVLLKYLNPSAAAHQNISLDISQNAFLNVDPSKYSKFSSLVVVNTYNHGVPHHFRSGQLSSSQSSLQREEIMKSKSNSNSNSSENLFDESNEIQESQESVSPLEKSYSPESGIPIVSYEKALNLMSNSSDDFLYRPILAIGASPSFYLRDYGVYGKEQYLENVWNHLNWEVLEERLMGETKKRNI